MCVKWLNTKCMLNSIYHERALILFVGVLIRNVCAFRLFLCGVCNGHNQFVTSDKDNEVIYWLTWQ